VANKVSVINVANLKEFSEFDALCNFIFWCSSQWGIWQERKKWKKYLSML